MLSELEINIILNLIKLRPFHLEFDIKNKYPDIYEKIISSTKFVKPEFREKLYNIIHPNTKLTCAKCGGLTNFFRISRGYNKYCSSKCSNSSVYTKEKKKISYINTYGVDNPSKSIEVKTKKKETCIKKFGKSSNLATEETKKLIKQTNLKKYNTEYPLQSTRIKQKRYNKTFSRLLIDERYKNISFEFTIDEFKGTNRKNIYKFKCKLCGDVFSSPIKDGKNLPTTCKICFPSNTSRAQLEIYEYIKSHNKDILLNSRKIIENVEIDIYIPSEKVGIEYNGLYWHSNIVGNKSASYHINKTNLCKEKNIKLIHIFEDEYRYNKKCILNKINHILNINLCEINSEHCLLYETTYDNALDISLLYDNKLAFSMRFIKNEECYVLKFNYTNYKVSEGIFKILTHFIKKYNPQKMKIVYDLRFPINDSIENLGFKLSKTLPPKAHNLSKFYTKRTEHIETPIHDVIYDCGYSEYCWENINA